MWPIIGIVACIAVLIAVNAPWGTVAGWFKSGKSADTRTAALAGYEAVVDHLMPTNGGPEVTAALETIWRALGRKA